MNDPMLVAVLAIILLGVPLWVVSVYNRLITLRNLAENVWAQTDVQLKRRYNLIPNLVETVKGYAAHEQQTLEKVTQASAQAENALTGAVKSVFAVAEAYPELKANQNFSSLQQELTATEGFIAEGRSQYNDAILAYNNALQVFPASAIAGVLKLQPLEFFNVPQQVEREPVKVQF